MRLRSVLATLAAGALMGPVALSAAPAQASAPPILFGLISPWSGSAMTTPQDDNQLGIRSGIVGSFFHWEKQAPNTTPFTNWLSWVHSRGAVPMPDLAAVPGFGALGAKGVLQAIEERGVHG